MRLKSTNIRWLLTRSVRIKSTKGRGESVRIANTYLNISPFDLSGLGCLAIFTCIIYISRSRGEDGARSSTTFPSSFHGQVPRRSRNFANKNFFFSFYYEMIYFFEKFRDSRIEWKVCILENGTWTENSSYHHFLTILFFSCIGVLKLLFWKILYI